MFIMIISETVVAVSHIESVESASQVDVDGDGVVSDDCTTLGEVSCGSFHQLMLIINLFFYSGGCGSAHSITT